MCYCFTGDIYTIKDKQRSLDNIPARLTAKLAVDGEESTCSHTDYANAGARRSINPYWAILFNSQLAISSMELVLSPDQAHRSTLSDLQNDFYTHGKNSS